MTVKWKTPSDFFRQPVQISVAGCGGTGSHLTDGLARLHRSLRALGNPHGLEVTVFDPDTMEPPNVTRQLFHALEVGANKAQALVHRVNTLHGVAFQAVPEAYEKRHPVDILVSCVDSRKARAGLRQRDYLLDCGNGPDYGQVLFGGEKLPHPYDTHPELIDTKVKEDNAPSCSLAEALSHQELFINPMVAVFALQLLWDMFRHGGLNCRGYYLGKDGVNPIKL